MLILLDTADTEKIEELIELYPIDGVTTNPSIIAKEERDFIELLKEIRGIIGDEKCLHVQVISEDVEGIIKEAKFLNKKIGGNLYIKIPVIPAGIEAIKILNKEGIKTTATAIFTPQQAYMAAKAGADFVAPYVNRLDNLPSSGIGVVSEIVEIFKVHNIDSKVLVASFKNVDQIHQSCLKGSHAVTATPELIHQLVSHPMTDLGVQQFINDWEEAYGKGKKITNL